MDLYLLSDDKDLHDNIQIYILMNIDNHWKQTLVYKLTKRKPSKKWIQQYKRIITRKFMNKELT